jgi:hypothetical protein
MDPSGPPAAWDTACGNATTPARRVQARTRAIAVKGYRDWHRVERMLAIVRLEVADLAERGWRRVPS